MVSYLDKKIIYWSVVPNDEIQSPLSNSIVINASPDSSPFDKSDIKLIPQQSNQTNGMRDSKAFNGTELKPVFSEPLNSKQALKILASSDLVTSIDAHPLEPLLFCLGSLDKFIRLYDISKETIVDWYQSTDFITALTFSPDARILVVGFSHGQCRVYTTNPILKYRCDLNCRNSNVKEINANKIINIKFLNHDEFIVASSDSRVRLFTCHNLRSSVLKYKGHLSEGPILKVDCDQ